MRTFFLIFLLILFVIVAGYFWYSLGKMQGNLQVLLKTIFWTGSFVFLFMAAFFFFMRPIFESFYPYTLFILIGIPFCFLLFDFFLILEELIFFIKHIFYFFKDLFTQKNEKTSISRSDFLFQIGFLFSFFPTVGAGILGAKGAHDYTIHRIKLRHKKIPKAFNGFKIIQLSDIHVGSFWSYEKVAAGIEKILAEKPDLIVFTGDLVNNTQDELDEKYQNLFAKLQAKHGVFSVLGNHDYGDYYVWKNAQEKTENLEKLKEKQKQMGWQLLCNESVIIEKETQKINLLGLENWGLHGFAQYGNMEKTIQNVAPNLFNILLSHDPSHWRGEVLEKYPWVDLSLAGHTHGFQFGLETPNFRLSPAQLRYSEWAGLYQEKDQFLYVNRGFGYLGFPGRIGIWPEITVFELETEAE